MIALHVKLIDSNQSLRATMMQAWRNETKHPRATNSKKNKIRRGAGELQNGGSVGGADESRAGALTTALPKRSLQLMERLEDVTKLTLAQFSEVVTTIGQEALGDSLF